MNSKHRRKAKRVSKAHDGNDKILNETDSYLNRGILHTAECCRLVAVGGFVAALFDSKLHFDFVYYAAIAMALGLFLDFLGVRK